MVPDNLRSTDNLEQKQQDNGATIESNIEVADASDEDSES